VKVEKSVQHVFMSLANRYCGTWEPVAHLYANCRHLNSLPRTWTDTSDLSQRDVHDVIEDSKVVFFPVEVLGLDEVIDYERHHWRNMIVSESPHTFDCNEVALVTIIVTDQGLSGMINGYESLYDFLQSAVLCFWRCNDFNSRDSCFRQENISSGV
jgi:hypothetical protein